MTPRAHDRLIAQAATRCLEPMGFRRKGRSRLWHWDRRWFLVVVEFQPHSWDVGSYLNVGANFLWHPKDYFSFDLGHRIEDFHPFESEEQFRPVADKLAEAAAAAARRIVRELGSFRAAARAVSGSEGEWAHFNRAVLSGLALQGRTAAALLDQFVADAAADDPPWLQGLRRRAGELATVVDDPRQLTAHLTHLNAAHRDLLGLGPVTDPFGSA